MAEPRKCIAILWAVSERYKTPNVVVAYSESLADMMAEEFEERIEEAKQWFLDFGDESDGPWHFWVDHEFVRSPPIPAGAFPRQELTNNEETR